MLCSRIKAEALQGQEKDDDSRPEAQNEVQEEKRDTNGGISVSLSPLNSKPV